jgi:hypothetical protein
MDPGLRRRVLGRPGQQVEKRPDAPTISLPFGLSLSKPPLRRAGPSTSSGRTVVGTQLRATVVGTQLRASGGWNTVPAIGGWNTGTLRLSERREASTLRPVRAGLVQAPRCTHYLAPVRAEPVEAPAPPCRSFDYLRANGGWNTAQGERWLEHSSGRAVVGTQSRRTVVGTPGPCASANVARPQPSPRSGWTCPTSRCTHYLPPVRAEPVEAPLRRAGPSTG